MMLVPLGEEYRTNYISDITSQALPTEYKAGRVKICGRTSNIKILGKIGFCSLSDSTGAIQLTFKKGTQAFDALTKKEIYEGCIICVAGTTALTPKGFPEFDVEDIQVFAKPEKYITEKVLNSSFLNNKKQLAMIINPKLRERFVIKAKMISSLRNFFENAGFVEFETSILNHSYDGGTVKPFVTRSHYFRKDLFLRVSAELSLRKLLISGYDKVFEIGRAFRNEGVSKYRTYEFTMLELHQAFCDYNQIIQLVEDAFKQMFKSLGIKKLKYEDKEIDIFGSWERVKLVDLVKKYCEIDAEKLGNAEEFQKASKFLDGTVPAKIEKGFVMKELLDRFIAPKLINPTFVTEFPSAMTPLAKKTSRDPRYSQVAVLYIGGVAVGDMYTDENDTKTLMNAFKKEDAELSNKIKQSHKNEEYLEMLLYGQPPSSGAGIGLSRFAAVVTGCNNIEDLRL